MSKKRVLITGAAGFLGSHLCDRFIKEGFHVVGMDNLITGDLKNIQHLLNSNSLNFIIRMLASISMYRGRLIIFCTSRRLQVQ